MWISPFFAFSGTSLLAWAILVHIVLQISTGIAVVIRHRRVRFSNISIFIHSYIFRMAYPINMKLGYYYYVKLHFNSQHW